MSTRRKGLLIVSGTVLAAVVVGAAGAGRAVVGLARDVAAAERRYLP